MKRHILIEIETDESGEQCGKNCPHYIDDKVIRKCKMPWREQFLVPTGICDYAFRDSVCLAAEIKVDKRAKKQAQRTVENMCPSDGSECETRNCANCEGYSARAYLAITEKMK